MWRVWGGRGGGARGGLTDEGGGDGWEMGSGEDGWLGEVWIAARGEGRSERS